MSTFDMIMSVGIFVPFIILGLYFSYVAAFSS